MEASMSNWSLTVIINNKPYRVEVTGNLATSPITVYVNDQLYLVNLETAEVVAAPARVTEPVSAGVGAPVHLPAPVVVKTKPEPVAPIKTSSLNGIGHAAIKAPMPGNILDIAVKVGDRVKVGKELCALEAMKMKSPIRSPQDGVIASVEVTEGETVSHGQVLFTFERGV